MLFDLFATKGLTLSYFILTLLKISDFSRFKSSIVFKILCL